MNITEAMRAAVELRGRDYLYPDSKRRDGLMCLYVWSDEGEPGCIVGTALHLMGVPLEQLAGYENMLARLVVAAVAPGLSSTEQRALNDAQSVQDDGRTWGEALDAFEKAMNP